MKLLSCIRYLARQGLPLQGHNENPELFQGNLCQLLLCYTNTQGAKKVRPIRSSSYQVDSYTCD